MRKYINYKKNINEQQILLPKPKNNFEINNKKIVASLIEKGLDAATFENEKKLKILLNFFTCDFLTINFVSREASLFFLKEYESFLKRKLVKVFTTNYQPKFSERKREDKELAKTFGLASVDVAINFCGIKDKSKKEKE